MFRALERDPSHAGWHERCSMTLEYSRERCTEAPMTKLGDITKSGILLTVQQDATVHEAVWLMDTHDAAIVTVLNGQRLAGVLSERDVVRRVVCRGLDPARTRVADVMTRRVIFAEVD